MSASSHATLYLQVPLGAVLCWDDATKQRLLFESFVFCGVILALGKREFTILQVKLNML